MANEDRFVYHASQSPVRHSAMNASWLKYLPTILRTRLKGRHGLQQAVGNSGWLFLDKALKLALGIVIGIWMARALGPVKFGQFSYALAFVALFASIASLGLDRVVVRDLVNTPEAASQILGSALLLKLVGSLLAISLCTGSIYLVNPDDSLLQVLVAVISLGMFFQSFDVIDFWFQSRVASKYVVIARLPSLLIFTAVRIFLILGALSLTLFAWAQALEVLFAAIGLIVVYTCLGERITDWRPLYTQALALTRECWPLILAGLSVMLYMKVDIVMLGKMSGDRSAGIYSAATRLSEGVYFIATIIVSSVVPMLLRARARGSGQYLLGLFRLYILMVRISLAIAMPLAVASPFLIQLLFGADFSEASTVLRVHIWASIAVFLGVASSQYLTNEGLQKLSLYRTLIGLLINILLNLFLIPAYGAVGAAIATLISYFAATFSIIISGQGIGQGILMLRALNPAAVFGFKGN
jgi:PST family polysaccharide transporter